MDFNGYAGREATFQHILHKKYGAGLIADLQAGPNKFDIDSMAHNEYFEKYLMEPEGLERLVAAVKTITKYEVAAAQNQIIVTSVTVPYLTGINDQARRYIADNINRIMVVFEKFPGKSDGEANGHFCIMWHFPATFNKKEHAQNKFCLFDPFGRTRKNDPEEVNTFFFY